ncbi:hypothetical protein [Haloferax volcanii]|uniref:Uncharacterized protein n=1 Tax=Haloferax volcanii TaxID=2246 RepID=A0A8T5CSG5_HALVO|nr:hypothetical protein [Haloferax volcanii]MBS8121295.1 hypothetical protein [Haloferax volcanii]MBS8126303.1 hypothetical protein [Haloferax volcanii]MBS8130173.1 hypothetical protein [Haloferax volcanii]MBS8134051.1 hypothetical protein [Haloferax volcanii]MDW7539420.1 hypothetical protein [Haloferax volcanii]
MMNESAKLKIWIEDHISLLAPICGLIALSVVVFTYSDFSILKFEIIYVAIGVAIAIIFSYYPIESGKNPKYFVSILAIIFTIFFLLSFQSYPGVVGVIGYSFLGTLLIISLLKMMV